MRKPHGPMRLLFRGLAVRCPWCAVKPRFSGWFKIQERCDNCGLIFQPDPSDFLAAATLAYGFAGAVWIVYLIIYLFLTLPGVSLLPLIASSIGVISVGGLLALRPAKTAWSALDLILCGAHRELRPEDAERFGISEPR